MIKAQRNFFSSVFAVFVFVCTVSAASFATSAANVNVGSINGVVLDLNGRAVANANVAIANSAAEYDRTTNTAYDGSFAFINVPIDRYEISASASGFGVTRAALTVKSEAGKGQTTLLLRPAQQTGTTTLSGTVSLGDSGQAVHDATVTILQLKRVVYTDEKGKYEFPSLPPGRYDVAAHLSGVPDAVQSVEVKAGTVNTLDIRLQLTGMKEQVTITATGAQQAVSSSIQSVDVIGSTDLAKKNPASLGAVSVRERSGR
jgi:Carboxypeptidase regulatory-like domain